MTATPATTPDPLSAAFVERLRPHHRYTPVVSASGRRLGSKWFIWAATDALRQKPRWSQVSEEAISSQARAFLRL